MTNPNRLTLEEKTRAIVAAAVELEGTHALDILYMEATRLQAGHRVYGPLNLLTDRRVWPWERLEEGLDRRMYDLFEDYATVLRAEAAGPDPSPAGRY